MFEHLIFFQPSPPPVLFTLNERNYFTTTSWHKFFLSKFNDATLPTNTILVLSTYSPFCWIVALVTILPRQITSVAEVRRPSIVTYHFPLISSCHHTPDLTIFLSEISLERELLILPETNLEQKIFHWKDKMILVTSFLRNITLKCKCTKANNFLGIVSSVLLHKQ